MSAAPTPASLQPRSKPALSSWATDLFRGRCTGWTIRRDAIKRAVDTIAKFTGKPPRSWESPGLTETDETLDLLRLNGIEYVADWVIDDLPQDIATPHGTITTIPYSVETNDIVIHALQHLPSEQFLKRCTDQFDRLYLEGATNARIMAISIHPYITGVPHRIKYLEALLDYVIGHDGVALMTASEIGDWYRSRNVEIIVGPDTGCAIRNSRTIEMI